MSKETIQTSGLTLAKGTELKIEGVMTFAMGLEDVVSPYYFENKLQVGDKILLYSGRFFCRISEISTQNVTIFDAFRPCRWRY